MARLPTPGGDDGNWGSILNDYLEVEHNPDGIHKTDYLPKSGGTMTGDVDADDNVFSQVEIKDYSESVAIANSGSAYTVNIESGNIVKLTLTGNCTLTLTNPPATGKAGSVTLILIQDDTGNRNVIWPDSVKWGNGTAPTLTTTASAIDIVQLFTVDGGITWFGFLAGEHMS